MRTATSNFLNKISASCRSIRAKVEFSDITYYSTDYIQEATVDAETENGKWFGVSISQKAVVKLLSVNHTFTVGSAFTLSLGVPNDTDPTLTDYVSYQPFYIDTIETDRKTGVITITGYDAVSKLNNYTYKDLNYSSSLSLTLSQIFDDCASKIGLVSNHTGGTNWGTTPSYSAINADEKMSLREFVNDIAEFTGTIIIVSNGQLTAKNVSSTVNSTIQKTNYYEATEGDLITLSGIASVDALDDTILYGTNTGFVQTLNDNVFLGNLTSQYKTYYMAMIFTCLVKTCKSYSLDWIGNPALEYGDTVRIYTDSSNYFDTFYLGEEVSYNGGLKSSSAWEKADSVAVDASASKNISTSIRSAEAKIDRVNSEIDLKVSKDGVISSINLSPETITINSSKINLTGYVTMTDLATSGSTTINGSNITTGTINANAVTISNIDADNITTGSLSADLISGGTITGSAISLKNSSETTVFTVNDEGALSTYGGNINTQLLTVSSDTDNSSLTPDTLTVDNVNVNILSAQTVNADTVSLGNSVVLRPSTTATTYTTRYIRVMPTAIPLGSNTWTFKAYAYSDYDCTVAATVPTATSVKATLYFGNPNTYETIEIKYNVECEIAAGSSTGTATTVTTSHAATSSFAFMPGPSNIKFTKKYPSTGLITGLAVNKRIIPISTGVYDLGASTNKWNDIYAVNGTIQTSDRNNKREIEDLGNEYSVLFDKLRPVSFKFNDGIRTHTGLIAQEVETALVEAEIDTNDFACFIKDKDENGNDVYGLRYSEIIALLIKEVQALKAKLKVLEGGSN